jgi:hypothetical protein
MVDKVFSVGDLPMRPAYEPGESLHGYLYRVCGSNDHRLSASLLEVLTSAFGDAAALKALNVAVGNAETMVQAWDPIARMRSFAAAASRKLLPAIGRIAYCALCLRSHTRHRMLWQAPCVWACAEHGCKLIDRCSGCGEELTWKACSPGWLCRCGASLPDGTVEAAPQHELVIAQLVEDGLKRGDQIAAACVVDSLMDGVELLRRVEQSGGIGIADAAKLLGRVLQDRRAVVVELVQKLSKAKRRFVSPPSGRLLRLIEWADDSRRPSSMLRHEVAAALRDFISEHQVQLPSDRTLLYAVNSASGPAADLQAFGVWFGCWDADADITGEEEDQIFGVRHSWSQEDEVIADILTELHRAFQRGAEGEFEQDLFSINALDYPLIVRDARHVVASIWMQLRPVPVGKLCRYLAELREEAAIQRP